MKYEMHSLHREGTDYHKEQSRQTRDNDDENSLVFTLQSFRVFSTALYVGALQYLATKDMATESIQEALLHAKELGQE